MAGPIGARSIRGQIQGKRGLSRRNVLPRISLTGPAVITVESNLVDTQAEAKWATELLRFLYTEILPYAVLDPVMRSKLVSAKAARIWIPAFTHVSYNPNDGENYEVLEKLGDSVMKLNFTWYMIRHVTHISEGQLGRLSDFYLSKEFQADLSNKYGFSKHILTNLGVSIHVKEDVLESFFGALFTTAEIYLPAFNIGTQSTSRPRNIGRLPLSQIRVSPACDVCYNFLSSIFERGDIKINFGLFLGPPTNQVKEIFEKMRWGSTNNVVKEIETKEKLSSGGSRITLTLTDKFMAWIDNLNAQRPQNQIVIKDRRFAQVTAPTTKVAKKKAYYNGLKYLESMGITLNWADSMKLDDPILAPYFPAARARALKDGIVELLFSKGKEGSKVLFTQLLGIDKDDRKYVLATIDGTPKSWRDQKPTKSLLKQAALRKYAKDGPDPRAVYYLDI